MEIPKERRLAVYLAGAAFLFVRSRERRISMNEIPTDPNPPYGKKGEFRKITVTLPPDVYERLIAESARRKIAGEPNQLLSALLREALYRYLGELQ